MSTTELTREELQQISREHPNVYVQTYADCEMHERPRRRHNPNSEQTAAIADTYPGRRVVHWQLVFGEYSDERRTQSFAFNAILDDGLVVKVGRCGGILGERSLNG